MENNRSSVKNALLHGDLYTRLSAVVMGLGMIGHKQVIKGILVLLCIHLMMAHLLSLRAH